MASHLLTQVIWIRDVLVVARSRDGAYSAGKSKASFLSNRQRRCRAIECHGVVRHIRLEIGYRLRSGLELSEVIVDSQVLTEPLIGQLALPGRFPF